jgi:hypothetical protein
MIAFEFIESRIMQKKCLNCLFCKARLDGSTILKNKFRTSFWNAISIRIAYRPPSYTTFIGTDPIRLIYSSLSNIFKNCPQK